MNTEVLGEDVVHDEREPTAVEALEVELALGGGLTDCDDAAVVHERKALVGRPSAVLAVSCNRPACACSGGEAEPRLQMPSGDGV